jgi:hypothetical protein
MIVKSVAEPNKVLLEGTLTRHMIPIIRQVHKPVVFLNTCGPEGFMNQPMGDMGQPPAAPLAR